MVQLYFFKAIVETNAIARELTRIHTMLQGYESPIQGKLLFTNTESHVNLVFPSLTGQMYLFLLF